MIRNFFGDERGGAIVENTITMWVFLLFTLGITQAGLIMWSIVGLQHGVEMAARCASVSDAAIAAGLDPATTPTPCYSTDTSGAANNKSTVESYAANNSWGVGVPLSTFQPPGAGSCASPSSLVSAPYRLSLMNFLFSVNVTLQSCYATTS